VTDEITSTDHGPVRMLAINRPERRNAMGPTAARALQDALRAAEQDTRIGAVVLTGTGEHFSAGGDAHAILEVASGDEHTARLELMHAFHGLIEGVWNSPLPILAAVSGIAYGGGFNLALACDLIVCAENARFCQVFLRRGLTPDLGGAYLLPRLVGLQRAKELIFFTAEITAEHAETLGLVNTLRPDAQACRAHAVELATRLAESPPFAVSLTKKLVNASTTGDLHTSLELEAVAQTAALGGKDARDAFEAFAHRQQDRRS
jgi:2-(1,2-epoxy-1,2-dihydrophenyl)acetyl-CoA isomerase